MDMFKLIFYNTGKDEEQINMADYDHVHTYLGDRRAIFTLWFILSERIRREGKGKIMVYDLSGHEQNMEEGVLAMRSSTY